MSDESKPNPDSSGKLEQTDPKRPGFVPENLDRTVIAIPLLKDLKKEDDGDQPKKAHNVIIDLNLEFPGDQKFPAGREGARAWVLDRVADLKQNRPEDEPDDQVIKDEGGLLSPQYVFALVRARIIRDLVTLDAQEHDR